MSPFKIAYCSCFGFVLFFGDNYTALMSIIYFDLQDAVVESIERRLSMREVGSLIADRVTVIM